jgi:hypothetical protein
MQSGQTLGRSPSAIFICVVTCAERLARTDGNLGAVAFGRSGDLATNEFSDAIVLRKFGEAPDDLSPL